MISRDTIFSPCRKYRYTLWRDWSDQIKGGLHFTEDPHLDYYSGKPDQFVQFIGLNPSTADETLDDPTIRRCINFAKAWGFGAMCMTNIFAWRDTDPFKMRTQQDPVGSENDYWITKVACEAGLIVAAWGTHGTHLNRGQIVKRMIPKLHCLKVTANGYPSHPLYLPQTLKPIEF